MNDKDFVKVNNVMISRESLRKVRIYAAQKDIKNVSQAASEILEKVLSKKNVSVAEEVNV